jgi:hypothetical protein
VLRELAAADTRALDPRLAARRAHFIEVLSGYRARGEFPQNDRYADRLVTIFVDDRGVHCAMGYLMAEDGRADLVAAIRAAKNTGTVWELAADPTLGPEIGAWLATTGLTLFEAARIQPTYCFIHRGGTCLCQGSEDATGIAEGTIVALVPGSGEVEVEVGVVHGTGATVGEVVRAQMTDDDAVGRKALVVVRPDAGNVRGPKPIAEDQVTCVSGLPPYPAYRATISKTLYVQALLSEDCIATLAAVDQIYDTSVCAIEQDEGVASGGGCAGGTATFGAGLALLALALGRRSARR